MEPPSLGSIILTVGLLIGAVFLNCRETRLTILRKRSGMQSQEKTCRNCLYFDILIPGAIQGTCFLNRLSYDETPTVNHNHTCDKWSDGEDAL